MRPARRIVKTEIALPPSPAGKALVVAALVVGGAVALAMVTLVSVFLFETFRSIR